MVTFVDEKRGRKIDEELQVSVRSMFVRADSASDESMSMEAILSTENPVRMVDWHEWEMMDEVLLCDGRQKVDYLPMLDSHSRWSVEDVLGHMNNVRTEGENTMVTCNFDRDDEDAVKIFRKYKNGHARALSVGYTVLKYVDIQPGQSAVVKGRTFTADKARKMRVCTEWRPDEGSLVVIGADSKAKKRTSQGARGLSSELTEEEFAVLKAERDSVRSWGANPVDGNSHVRTIEAIAQPLQAIESTQQPTVVINVNGGEAVRSQESKPAAVAATSEGSVVDPVNQSVPADAGGNQERSGSMPTQLNADTSAAEAVDVARVRADAIQEGIRLERERQDQIRSLAGDDVSPECLDKCLKDPAMTVDAARAAFLADIRASRAVSKPVGGDSPSPIVSNGRRSKNPSVDVLTAAVALRIGGEAAVRMLPYMQYDANDGSLRMRRLTTQITEEQRKAHERIVNDAYEFERRESVEICEYALRASNVELPDSDHGIVTRAFSTPAVSSIYTQTMGAILLMNLGEMKDSTQGWCREQDVANFKPNELHRLEGGRLTKRNRGETARQASFADTMESFRLYEYANTLNIDRQDLIDDDLNAWSRAMEEYARGIQDLRPSLVYGFMATNAALATDGVALFHATHSNLLTTSALAAATLQTAVTALASARGAWGLNLNLRECVLVTSETLSFTADQLTSSAEIRETAAANGTVNPLRQRNIATRSDSRLNNGFVYPVTGAAVAAASTTWYLAAAGGAYGMQVGYRKGTNRMPTMNTVVLQGGGKYGLSLDVNFDIGVGVESYQGIVKATA